MSTNSGAAYSIFHRIQKKTFTLSLSLLTIASNCQISLSVWGHIWESVFYQEDCRSPDRNWQHVEVHLVSHGEKCATHKKGLPLWHLKVFPCRRVSPARMNTCTFGNFMTGGSLPAASLVPSPGQEDSSLEKVEGGIFHCRLIPSDHCRSSCSPSQTGVTLVWGKQEGGAGMPALYSGRFLLLRISQKERSWMCSSSSHTGLSSFLEDKPLYFSEPAYYSISTHSQPQLKVFLLSHFSLMLLLRWKRWI